jgi:hypothetical protein
LHLKPEDKNLQNFKIMKNEKLEKLKSELGFIELDQRLEMVKIPMLSSLSCGAMHPPADDCSCEDEESEEIEESN